MSFRFIYCQEVSRIIPSCLIDARASIPAIANKIGTVIKAYCDAEVAKVTSTVIPYRIETNNGNLAGYFTLQFSDGIVSLYQKQLRPAFYVNDAEIQDLITNFITSATWEGDILI